MARAVPAGACALACLRDALERADGTAEALGKLGLTDDEATLLALLTRGDEPYRAHLMRIARAGRRAGRIGRTNKPADLEDRRSRRGFAAGAPDYAWARRQILAWQLVTVRPRPHHAGGPSRDRGVVSGRSGSAR